MSWQINAGLLDTKAPERAANAFYEGQQQQQQNALMQSQLKVAQRQNKLAELAMADDEANRQAWKEANGDTGKVVQNLMSRGQGKQAMELQGKLSEQQKAKLGQAIEAAKLLKTYASSVYSNPTQENAAMAVQQYGQQTGQDMTQQMQLLKSFGGDPAKIKQWAEGHAMDADKVAELKLNLDKFEETKANNLRVDKRANQGLDIQRGNLEQRKSENSKGAGADGLLDADTLKTLGEQYLAGDTSVFTNLGRGAQGGQNVVALRREIARQNREGGATGADLAAKNAEYGGIKAGQRTVGTRTANIELAASEAESVLPLAREASAAVSRSGLLPFGKAQVMFNEQTNNPAMRQFAAANNTLINVYARAISPTGVPTVHDKEHAREMLSTAFDQTSYNATLDQMEKEIAAARGAPASVRKGISNAVTGRNAEKPSGGGIPSDIADLLKKHGGK